MATKTKKKESKIFSSAWYRILLLVVGTVLTTLVLTFSVLAMIRIQNEQVEEAPKFLVWVFICLGLTKFIPFFCEINYPFTHQCFSWCISDFCSI